MALKKFKALVRYRAPENIMTVRITWKHDASSGLIGHRLRYIKMWMSMFENVNINESGNERQEVCKSLKCASVRVSTPPSSEQKRQASAVLGYSDMTHAMSTASDGCSSFNCMSALNDGILNSYTFHTTAFHTGRSLGRQPRLSVAIWRGRQSPCWVIGSLPPHPCTRLAAILYWSCRQDMKQQD